MIYCTNCGAEIAEGQAFCTSCGKAVEVSNETVAPTEAANEATNETVGETVKKKKLDVNKWAVAGIVVGCIAFFVGLSMLGSGGFSYKTAGVYGADYYTEVASRLTSIANDLAEAKQIIAEGFGTLLMVIGGIDICYFGNKLRSK